jgi:homoserine O-acetyltransferase
MGGMQTFQWLVQYPEFMERAVAVVGTPRQTSHDLLLWNAMLHATLNDPGYRNGVHSLPALASEISDMELTTPEYRVQHTPPDQFASFLSGVDRGNDRLDADNVIRQLGAMLKHDISADFGESMERAAAAVKARVLIITALQDHMVNPIPALAFVPLVNAKELELSSNCGHLAPGCEMPKVIEAIRGFLAAK